MMNPDLATTVEDWQRWLKRERRSSPHTLAAYGLDLSHFLRSMSDHLGKEAWSRS